MELDEAEERPANAQTAAIPTTSLFRDIDDSL
jgi:hypothetical protein